MGGSYSCSQDLTVDQKPERRIAGVHVVMLGDFNPAILHPSWLTSKNLIAIPEAEAAEIQVGAESCAFSAPTGYGSEWSRTGLRQARRTLPTTCP